MKIRLRETPAPAAEWEQETPNTGLCCGAAGAGLAEGESCGSPVPSSGHRVQCCRAELCLRDPNLSHGGETLPPPPPSAGLFPSPQPTGLLWQGQSSLFWLMDHNVPKASFECFEAGCQVTFQHPSQPHGGPPDLLSSPRSLCSVKKPVQE